jgi:hypothetical protein
MVGGCRTLAERTIHLALIGLANAIFSLFYIFGGIRNGAFDRQKSGMR